MLALGVGAVDGLYFHLWKYRLYSRARSRREHVAHTGRALLLAPTLWLAFGALEVRALQFRIYALGSLIAIDGAIGIWDALIEQESRRDLGGLPRYEYLVHVIATAFHSSAEALAVVGWLSIALGWTNSAATWGLPPFFRTVSYGLTAGAIAVALVHLALLHPHFTASNPALPGPSK